MEFDDDNIYCQRENYYSAPATKVLTVRAHDFPTLQIYPSISGINILDMPE